MPRLETIILVRMIEPVSFNIFLSYNLQTVQIPLNYLDNGSVLK